MRNGCPADIELGERIRLARKQAGLSMVALAQRIGVSHGAISQFERGKCGVSIETLRRIAAATGTNLSELFGGAPQSEYVAVDAGVGVLAGDASRWPDFMQGEAPVYWPGTLRSFVSSAAAEMARLGPDEVPLLAKIAAGMNDAPLDDAGWMHWLAVIRVMTGGKGRPVLLETVPIEPAEARPQKGDGDNGEESETGADG